jgi:hypothetical protein
MNAVIGFIMTGVVAFVIGNEEPKAIPYVVIGGSVLTLLSVRGSNPTPRDTMNSKGIPVVTKKNKPL